MLTRSRPHCIPYSPEALPAKINMAALASGEEFFPRRINIIAPVWAAANIAGTPEMHSSKRFLLLFFLTAALIISLCCINPTAAQVTVATAPVGFTTTSLLGNSDTYASIPFTRSPEFVGGISSAATTGATGIITVAGNPWTANQFVYGGTQNNHYYVLIGPISGTGTKEGRTYLIIGNGTGTLIVDTSNDDSRNLNTIPANTQVQVIPYWTPATIFPASDAGVSFTPTSSPPTYQTLLRFPNYSAPGINQPYAAEYYFNSGAWRLVSDGFNNPPDHGGDPLLPDGYFVVRNTNGAPTLPLRALGSVLMKKTTVSLFAAQAGKQDNPVTMIRPVGVSLDATGLAPIDNSFVQNDQLLLFNNARRQLNKHPYRIYTYNDGWRLSTDPIGDHGKDVIPAGSAMIVRKAAAPNGPIFWTNSPTYVTATSLLPLQVASRKSHGGAGTFDINMPMVGTKGIEPRTGGASGDHQIMFTFANNVSLADASVTPGQNGAGRLAGPPVVNGKRITLNLTGVTNRQVLTVNLTGVSDGLVSSDLAIPVGVLAGDTNMDDLVNAKDVNRTKTASGRVVSRTNFTIDVNLDGQIGIDDTNFVKSFLGTALP
ncbi:MAG: hypothetical protein DME32_06455 [Verrucomicrobia bacterium]|nr:MAG: hypothetical protein DME32_06455 [Verrucomicrobiota bacterium]